jgi:hypothetical protein
MVTILLPPKMVAASLVVAVALTKNRRPKVGRSIMRIFIIAPRMRKVLVL